MGKAGGIVGILGGVFGFIAAVITLFVGGIGGALQAEGAGTVVGLGWGGVLFSFLCIVFGAVAFARPRGAGIGLVVVSIAGAVLGGTLVAICMVLALIGGILAMIGGAKQAPAPAGNDGGAGHDASPAPAVAAPAAAAPKSKLKTWGATAAALLVMLAVINVIGRGVSPGTKKDALAELAAAPASGLRAEGELSALFAIGSRNTDLQRESALKEITGQVVEWTLPVYEVSRSGSGYRIQTETKVKLGGFGSDLVGTFVTLTPRSDDERRQIESLRTGDRVTFKGRITGTTLRNLNIQPAILAGAGSVLASAPVPPTQPVATPAVHVVPVSTTAAAKPVIDTAAPSAAAPNTPPATQTAPAVAAPAVPSAPVAENARQAGPAAFKGVVNYSGRVSRMDVVAELSFDGQGGVSGWWSVTNDPKLRGQRFRLEGAADDGRLQLREYEGERHALDVQLEVADARLGVLRGKAYNRPPRSEVWEVSLLRRD